MKFFCSKSNFLTFFSKKIPGVVFKIVVIEPLLFLFKNTIQAKIFFNHGKKVFKKCCHFSSTAFWKLFNLTMNHGTEVAFMLTTQLSRVRFSLPPQVFLKLNLWALNREKCFLDWVCRLRLSPSRYQYFKYLLKAKWSLFFEPGARSGLSSNYVQVFET